MLLVSDQNYTEMSLVSDQNKLHWNVIGVRLEQTTLWVVEKCYDTAVPPWHNVSTQADVHPYTTTKFLWMRLYAKVLQGYNICMQKDNIRTLKILWSMSELGGSEKHPNNPEPSTCWSRTLFGGRRTLKKVSKLTTVTQQLLLADTMLTSLDNCDPTVASCWHDADLTGQLWLNSCFLLTRCWPRWTTVTQQLLLTDTMLTSLDNCDPTVASYWHDADLAGQLWPNSCFLLTRCWPRWTTVTQQLLLTDTMLTSLDNCDPTVASYWHDADLAGQLWPNSCFLLTRCWPRWTK